MKTRHFSIVQPLLLPSDSFQVAAVPSCFIAGAVRADGVLLAAALAVAAQAVAGPPSQGRLMVLPGKVAIGLQLRYVDAGRHLVPAVEALAVGQGLQGRVAAELLVQHLDGIQLILRQDEEDAGLGGS